MSPFRLPALILILFIWVGFYGCKGSPSEQQPTIDVVDQLRRTVNIPQQLNKIATLQRFGGKIVFALKQQDKLVEQAIYGKEAEALSQVDSLFAARPSNMEGRGINIESLVALGPQVVFAYASNDRSEMQQLENAGISVIAVKGETFDESFEAVTLMAKVLNCPEKGAAYVEDCRRLLGMVENRLSDIPDESRLKVLFTGPKSIYSVATGEMLQSEILKRSGAKNVAADVPGYWADVSPEQIAVWNPDIIFLGSSLNTYDLDMVYNSAHFDTIKAVSDKKVYVFPSNIGWWDYPAPHCVLGVVWSAKMLYPDQFENVDILELADEFYKKYVGYTFTEMGGIL